MFDRHPAARFIDGQLKPIPDVERVAAEDVIGLVEPKRLAMQNVIAFMANRPALDMLLWGSRGGGKSTLIKMLLTVYRERGLRIVEFAPEDILHLADLYAKLRLTPHYHFLISFDDISFDASDSTFRRFKSVIEGGIERRPDNVLFVASSNKRFLVSRDARTTETSMFEADDVNEETSLAARFGLQLGFYPLSKEEYFDVVRYYFGKFEMTLPDNWEKEAESFAMDRGGRSGRTARQFAAWVNVESTSID